MSVANERPMVDKLTLDANAVSGLLWEVFGVEMTARLGECANCGNRAPVGTLRAYVQAPGTVLRCSICAEVVMRLVRKPDGACLVDARGAAWLELPAG
jgi:ribosomal protein L24E